MLKDRLRQIVLIGLGIIIIFYAIEWLTPAFSLSGSLRNSALIVFRYPLNFLSRLYVGSTNISDIFKLSKINQENFDLKENNLKLIQENETLKEKTLLLDKYEELTNFFPTLETIPAESRGYFEEGGRSYFIINKGSLDGVVLDKGVVWGKYLVGKISEVNPKESVAETILSKDLVINITVASSPQNGLAVAKGAIGQGLEAEGFPSNIEIKNNDLVLTSGLGGIMPPNLIVGRIIEKISQKSETSQKFLIEPLLNFRGLEFMQIIKD